VASLSQGRTAAAQCGLFTHKSVPVIFEPPCNSNDHWNAQRIFQRDYILIGLHSDVNWERTHQLFSLSGHCWTDNRTVRGHNLILMIFWLWIHFTTVKNSKTVIPTTCHVLKLNCVESTSSGRCKFTLYHITGRHFFPDWKGRPISFRETFTTDRQKIGEY